MNVEEVDSGVYSEMLGPDIDKLENTEVKTADPQLMKAIQIITNSVLRNLKLDSQRLRTFTDREEANRYIIANVANVYNRVKKNQNLLPCFAIVNAVTGMIGNHVGTAFSTLSGEVAHDAEKLEQNIDEGTEEVLEDEGVTGEKADEAPQLKLQRVKWDSIINRFGGLEVLTDNIRDYSKLSATLDVDEAIAIGDSVNNTEEDVELDKETAKDVQERVVENINVPENKEAEVKEATAEMYKVITSNYHMHNFMYTLYMKALKDRRYGRAILDFSEGVKKYLPILQAFKKTALNVSDEHFDKLHKNMDVVLMNFEVGAYAMASIRKRMMEKNTILLDEGVVNPDVEEKEAEEGAPINDTAMAVYFHGFCDGDHAKIPVLGVKASDIRLYKDKAANVIKEQRLAKKANLSAYQSKAKLQATEKALYGYLESIDSSFVPKGLTRSDFIKGHLGSSAQKVLHQMNNNGNKSLQGLLYDFVIDVKYPTSKLKALSNLFSDTVADTMREHENDGVDDKDLEMIDSTVATKMVVKTLDDLIF